ncbi:fibronectin type III domain-containing protein [Saccharicrinis fermentans]|uniref:Fibronectin type III domain protein n=1 Tax=Saccharicrinis fermentans DSM 9555 = JCM 21142 TaxID=869213 RepID=W7Y3M4_9BACT|nr:fibronectin type III domain-containing protein [Saccharicrinis fermentans]GAF02178.1 fibronectin type III domain protein [Saccharicrinis fermentans DSM 9555 = JCM 21142]
MDKNVEASKRVVGVIVFALLLGVSSLYGQRNKLKITIDTTNGHSLQEGCSGFNVRIADKVWSYSHPDFRKAVHGLKPGWLRYFSGTMGDAFNSATGLYDKDYIMMFDHPKPFFTGYEFTQVKGPHRLIDLYELLGEVGGKLIITVNGFTETPEVVKELARFCKNNHIQVEAWQFCNEPYFYVPHRDRYWWNDGYDYATKMKPYAEAIQEVFPDAKLALNCTWDGIWGFMKEIHKYQEENGAYWNVFSKHSYAPHVGGKEAFSKGLKRVNTKVIEATSPKAMKQIEDYTWKGAPLMITEFGVWNAPLNGIVSAVYNAEYTLRQLQHPNAFYIGSHEISNKYRPAKNFNKVIKDAYANGEKINTAELLTGIKKDDEGKAIEMIHEATNNSVYTWNTSIENNVQVLGLNQKKVDGMYARAFKGINGYDYLLVTNRSDQYLPTEVWMDHQVLKGKVMTKYMFSELAENKNIPTYQQTLKGNDLIIRPYSVTLFKWKSNEKYAPSAPRIYKTKVVDDGIELTWWKRDIAKGYKIIYGTDVNNLNKEIVLNGADKVSAKVSGLVKGQQYYLAVKAFNREGESALSPLVHLRYALPEQPMIFKTAKRDTTITVMWKSVENATGYTVAVNDGKNIVQYDAKNVFGYRIEGLQYDVPYHITVAAYNGLGSGKNSLAETVSCKKNLPYPPRNISAKETADGHVYLEWVAQDTIHPHVKYRLYRGKKLHQFEVLAEDIDMNNYLDRTAKHEDNYYYTVKSYNEDGECNFYPNIATVIKRDHQILIEVKDIVEGEDVFSVTVQFKNIKRDGNVRYGVSVSDISYLNVEEDLYESSDLQDGMFTVHIPKDKFKKGRTYAFKGFVNTNGKSIFSLPPHKNLHIK